MCQIDFTISASSERLNNISSAQGRYKLTSQSESVNTWTTPFNISDIQDAKTPDIVIEGDYDFNVRVKDSEDIYSEWFVVYGGFKIGNCVPDEPNIAPTVSVAFDSYSMTLPTNQTNLQATASDADGNIVSYLWTKVAGGNVNIVSPTSITTDITGMVEDSYTFRCTVTDNDGLTASDQKDINVFTQQPTLTPFYSTSGVYVQKEFVCDFVAAFTLLYHDGTDTLPSVGDTIYAGSTTSSQTVSWSNHKGFNEVEGDNSTVSGTTNAQGVIASTWQCQ